MALYTVNTASVVNAADVNQFTNLLNGTTTNTSLVVANRIRAQLTGATTGTGGYVGQTASSAPISGSFNQGDVVVDGAFGTTWVCTSAGSPGSWVATPTQIATQTLSGTAASVSFSSIPSFNHVGVIWKARGDAATTAQQIYLHFNADATAHYFWQHVEGNNATTTSANSGGAVSQLQIGTIPGSTASANCFGCGNFTVSYWNDTTNNTTVQGTAFALMTTTNMYSGTYGGMYNVVGTALTSLSLFPASGNFVAGSRFSLYGWM